MRNGFQPDAMNDRISRVVVVGGGFGGLAAAKVLRSTPAQVIVLDRTNHHLFQPLLYQVAISVLTPGQIASPIRAILRKQRNTTVTLGEVTGVDKDPRCVFVNSADRERSISFSSPNLTSLAQNTINYWPALQGPRRRLATRDEAELIP